MAPPSTSTAPCNWAFGEKSWCLPPLSSATGATAEIASAEQCRIHILDVPLLLGRSLHPVCTPCDWEWHQYAMELWLDRAVRAWPNLVSRAEDADLVVVSGADFGRWCTAAMQISHMHTRRTGHSGAPSVYHASVFEGLLKGKTHAGMRYQLCEDGRASNETTRSATKRRRRKVVGGFDDVALGGFAEQRADGHLLVGCTERTKKELWRTLTQQRVFRLGRPTLVAATNTECQTPWINEKSLPRSVLLVKDRTSRAPGRRGDVVAPFSVSSPPWLAWRGVAPRNAASSSAAASAAASADTSAATATHTPPLPELPWIERQPLLFFAGHAPKLQPQCPTLQPDAPRLQPGVPRLQPHVSRHVPKLYVGSPQRYQLWRQARTVPGVLAISSTINCTIGVHP